MRESRRFSPFPVLGAFALVLAAGPAWASFHLTKVVEVFPGTPAAPNAQYVVVQMYFSGQNFVGGHSVVVFDPSGVAVGTFTFSSTLANGASQAKMLIATQEAEAFFGVTADLEMTPGLPAGGKVCFDSIDCVAWGDYAPIDSAVGTPFNGSAAPAAGTPRRGLVSGKAIVRRLDIAGSPTALDFGDDTNDSANDFRFATPAPSNNAGQSGSVPASVCGNTTIEGLESCDDGGTVSGDGCSATCFDEFCGDSAINDVDEVCDDGNQASGDGCDANCTPTGCGNGILTAGETCEPPNLGVCSASCTLTGVVTPVDWNSATAGTAGAVAASLDTIASPAISSFDLSTPEYSAAPLAANQEIIDYETGSDWHFAVAQPVDVILLYAVNWRGGQIDVDPVTYDFDAPFTIVSGFAGASVANAGRQLVLPGHAGVYDGVLEFGGPISGVALDVNSSSTSHQALTFGVVMPEPADATAVAFLALLALRCHARRRSRSRAACSPRSPIAGALTLR